MEIELITRTQSNSGLDWILIHLGIWLTVIYVSLRPISFRIDPFLKARGRQRLYILKLKALGVLKQIITLAGFDDLLLHRVVEVQQSKESIDGILDYRLVQPPRKIEITNPYHKEFLRHSIHFKSCVYYRRESFVCSVDRALYDPATGVVATKDKLLLAESAMEEGRLTASTSYKSFVPRPKVVKGTYATIWHMWGYNYYHWLVDCLPRFYSLKATHDPASFKLLMPERMVGFQEQSLAAYIPPETEVIRVAADQWLQVDRMLLPSFVTYKACGDLPEDHAKDLRETIFSYCGLDPANRPEKNIYISRRNAPRRRMANEPEMLEMLEGYGFESYVLEDMSFYDQVRLFHSANAVVAPHGAGLANILFSGHIKVLDIYPHGEPNTCFFFLSRALKQDYSYILSDGNAVGGEFQIDLDMVEDKVQRMLGNRVFSANV